MVNYTSHLVIQLSIYILFKECNITIPSKEMWCQLLYLLDDDDNESTSTRDDEEGDSSANILVYCGELVSAVLEMKDTHGRVICHLFKKLPPQSVSIDSIDSFHCCITKKWIKNYSVVEVKKLFVTEDK